MLVVVLLSLFSPSHRYTQKKRMNENLVRVLVSTNHRPASVCVSSFHQKRKQRSRLSFVSPGHRAEYLFSHPNPVPASYFFCLLFALFIILSFHQQTTNKQSKDGISTRIRIPKSPLLDLNSNLAFNNPRLRNAHHPRHPRRRH